MNDRLSLFTRACVNTHGRNKLMRNAYKRFTRGYNSLNVCMCLTGAYITDRLWITDRHVVGPRNAR